MARPYIIHRPLQHFEALKGLRGEPPSLFNAASAKDAEQTGELIEPDLLRKSGEFFFMKEDLDDEAETVNEGI